MKDLRGTAVFRITHTFPLIMAPIVVGFAWKLMTTPSIWISNVIALALAALIITKG